MNRSVFVFGSINIDFISRVSTLPHKGQTLLGTYSEAGGGKGANQALAASKLGAKTYFVGATGIDSYGKTLTANLKLHKVITRYIEKSKLPTGRAFITVDQQGSNTIIVMPEANKTVKKTTISPAVQKISANDIVVAQLEIPLSTVEYLFAQAKKKKAVTILNPSPITKLPKSLLQNVTILVLNETEAQILSENSSKNPGKIAQALYNKFKIQTIIITLGEKGVILYENHKLQSFKAVPVKNVDTTGAGDAFTGALAATLAQNDSLEVAIKIGTVAGALATTKYGAQPSLPTHKDVYSLYKKLKK